MARLLTEGFELNSISIFSNASGYSYSAGNLTISSTITKNSSYALRMNAANNGGGVTFQYATFSSGIRYHRFHLYINSITSIPTDNVFLKVIDSMIRKETTKMAAPTSTI
jgi:hypothetical protein